VQAAVKNFAGEEFGLRHRYAMVLHTDEPHPHVHMVLKAVSGQGKRLHIRKAALRHWRQEFARHLQLLGVEANATARAVRAETRTPRLDGIYRAAMRGDSVQIRTGAVAAASEILQGDSASGPGKAKLLETRKEVERGWRAVGEILVSEGYEDLAAQVRRFAAQMSPPRTDSEVLAFELFVRHQKTRERSGPRSR
jgi:hypothetical protein